MDITRLCFVCEKTLNFGAVKTLKKKGIQTLIKKSENYRDDKWKLFKKTTEIRVHDRCHLDYSIGAFRIPEGADSPLSRQSSRVSSTDSFDFKSLCLFCQKSYAKERGKKYIIAAESLKSKFLKVAEKRNDDLAANLISIINTIPSLVDVQARYHSRCYSNFVYIPRVSTSTEIPDPRVQNTLQLIYNYIENHDECQFSIKELREVGNNEISDKTILKYLKLKYNEDITITTRPRKDTTIYYSGTRSLGSDIMNGIYSTDSDDNDDEVNEDDDTRDPLHEVPVELPSQPSTSDEQPAPKRRKKKLFLIPNKDKLKF